MRGHNFFNFALLLPIVISLQACANTQSKGLSIGDSSSTDTTAFSKATTGKRQALVVGVSDYAGTRSDLGGIERDVSKMRQLFESWGFEVKVLYDKDSMKIVDYLTKYGNNLGSDDLFSFYYSGHGSHKKDENGDESDGVDETLVLSDGKENSHLIDDILFAKFNAIKAKKLIFFDSCHSGTVFRSLNGKTQPKTISPKSVTKSFSKGLSIVDSSSAKSDTIDKTNDFVVFSSSQDNEESLATPTGSLFTNAVSEIFTDSSTKNRSLNDIGKMLTAKVLAYAQKTDGTPHHPNISFSKGSLGLGSFQSFVSKSGSISTNLTQNSRENIQTVQSTLDSMINNQKIQKMIINYNKSSYSSGESVEFIVNTGSDRGYLTIFYVDSNDVTLLYPNPFVKAEKLQGKYSFPKDLSNGKFNLEAFKSCQGCQEEKTTIYALLSSEPIADINSIQSKGGLLSFSKGSNESKIMMRAVRVKATNNDNKFKPQLGKYEFIVR
jgi:uncharacterized FlaG/YvyC family protein